MKALSRTAVLLWDRRETLHRAALSCSKQQCQRLQAAPCSHLLHGCVAAGQVLPQVRNVVVTLLHVLLEVLSEVQQGFLYLTLKLAMKTKEEMAIMRSQAVIPGSSQNHRIIKLGKNLQNHQVPSSTQGCQVHH